jgi:hypothetical protein
VTIGNNPRHGVPAPKDYKQTSAQQLKPLQLTGGKGGIVDVYYQEFAMQLRTHPRLFAAISELWAATYASDQAREKQIGGSGGSLEPRGPLPMHLHTVHMAYSECLPTLLKPLAERNCFSQVSTLARRSTTAT